MAENKKNSDVLELHNFLKKKKEQTFNRTLVGGKYDISSLTERQQTYFRIMYPKSGMLYVTGKPGIAKSAILRDIAEKLNLFYIDIRLSQIDETDVGLYPDKKSMLVKYTSPNGQLVEKSENFLTHIIPEWAYLANNPQVVDEKYVGTLINFEELNRAPLSVRNAALQLFLERRIGFTGFKFADNVFMASTGNLGDADGTDVEEFDAALMDRLIRVEHDMDFVEWRDTWASKDLNIHSAIIGFLQINGEHYYSIQSKDKKNDKSATPRSWTFLSDALRENFGQVDENGKVISEPELTPELIDFVVRTGHFYIGSANQPFVRYLHEVNRITIYDILGIDGGEGFANMSKEKKESMDRSKRSELLDKLKRVDISTLNTTNIENLKLFILSLKDDEAVSYYWKVVDTDFNEINLKDINPAIIDILNDPRFKVIKKKLTESVYSV